MLRRITGWAILLMAASASPLLAADAVVGVEEPDPLAESLRRGEAYAHLMRSLFDVRDGEYGSAVEEIHGALAIQPDSADLLIESARMLTLMHRDAEAERLARRALTLDAEHVEAMLFLADMAAERAFRSRSDEKSREEAIRLYRRLADSEEDLDPEILRKLTRLEHDGGNLPGAVEAARRLVRARPGDRRGAIMLAELLLQSGQREEGLRGLLSYVADHPFDEEVIRWAKELVMRLNGWHLVDEVLSPRAPYSPDMLQVSLFHAEALRRAGKGERAVEALEALREGRPHDEVVRRQLAFTYRELRRMADAAIEIAGLLEEFPEDPFYSVLLADTLSNQGDRPGALRAYERAVSGFGVDAERVDDRDAFRQRMVLIHLDLDDADGARAVIRQMEKPDGPLALEARARLAIYSQDWSGARQASKKLRNSGEDQVGFAALLDGEIAVREKKWSEAHKRFADAVKRLGPGVSVGIAEVYRRAERADSGEQLLREWVLSEPENADAHYNFGAYLYQLERFDEAEREMREAFELEPNHAPALNFLGYSLAERKQQLDEALDLVQRALEIDRWNGAYLDSLGWVYYQMGRYDEARSPLERAARELPHDPTILEHLGDVYLRLGEPALALANWVRAIDQGPEDADALQRKIDRERSDAGSGGDEGARAESRTQPPRPVPR